MMDEVNERCHQLGLEEFSPSPVGVESVWELKFRSKDSEGKPPLQGEFFFPETWDSEL